MAARSPGRIAAARRHADQQPCWRPAERGDPGHCRADDTERRRDHHHRRRARICTERLPVHRAAADDQRAGRECRQSAGADACSRRLRTCAGLQRHRRRGLPRRCCVPCVFRQLRARRPRSVRGVACPRRRHRHDHRPHLPGKRLEHRVSEQVGAITEYALPGGRYAASVAAGPDGNVWFTEWAATGGRIGRITPSGTVSEFTSASTGRATRARSPWGPTATCGSPSRTTA